MSEPTKKTKDYQVGVRYTEDEYLDILLKISDETGEQIMSVGAFTKKAALEAKVKIIDKEVEQYKVFIASKISNNLNQISKRLNSDFKSNKVSEKTYINVLENLNNLSIELKNLMEPLR